MPSVTARLATDHELAAHPEHPVVLEARGGQWLDALTPEEAETLVLQLRLTATAAKATAHHRNAAALAARLPYPED